MSGKLSAYHFYRMIWIVLDWMYPPTCGGCGNKGDRWCVTCRQNLKLIPQTICLCCGRGVKHSKGICQRCRSDRPAFTMARSWAYFEGPSRNVLHRLKYNRDVALGEVLARPLIQMLRDLDLKVELVIPVPLGVARFKERGYNQAALLARPIALAQKTQYCPNGIKRVRETQSQVGLSFMERKANVRGAFQSDASIVAHKIVLLIDDVMTSGATLDACSQAALNANAREVYCLTYARAVD